MKAKHTGGRWMVASDKTSVLAITPVDMNKQKPFPVVVDCVSGHDAMSFKEAKANAQLIAAVPELLDVLLRASDAIEALDGTSIENEKLVDDYRAIIARVTGTNK